MAKAFWETKNPKKESKKLTPSQKASAKARAAKAGRPYPNLVDNAAVSKKDNYCWGGKVMKKAQGGMASGGKWIQSAIKKPGALHKALGVPEGKKIPAAKLEKASHAPGKMGKRARLAMTLKGMK